MSDLSLEVNNLNYDRAHRCYLAYYTGSGSQADQDMGKAVAASSKWQSYITKWQSEDTTMYLDSGDVDENGESTGMTQAAKDEINELNKDSADKSNKGGLAGAGVMGSVAAAGGATMALIAKSVIAGSGNGNVIAAAVYCAFSAIFLGVSEKILSNAKQNRELQDSYVAKAEEHITYNYEAAAAKSQELSDIVSAQDALVKKVGEKADGDVNLANAVAEATETSNTEVNTAALGQGDKIAGEAYDKLEGLNTEMLDTIGEYDSIMAEVNTNKSIVNSIKTEMPKFKQQRANDKLTEYMFAGAGAIGVIGGLAGAVAAWGANIPVITPVAIALYAAGAIMFGVAAVRSMLEGGKQKQGEQTATTKVDESNTAANNAETTSSQIKEQLNASNSMYQDGLNLQKDMDKEDANLNGALA